MRASTPGSSITVSGCGTPMRARRRGRPALSEALANDRGAGAEEDLPFSLDARRETLEATIRLRRYEPYGVCGGEELVEGRRVPECQRDDLNACGSRLGKANVRGGDDLMPAERGQILEKRRAHCQTFARERCRHSVVRRSRRRVTNSCTKIRIILCGRDGKPGLHTRTLKRALYTDSRYL